MQPALFFRFCPRCGAARAEGQGGSPFQCAACGFTFYFNAAIAAVAFVRRPDGRMLFVKRAKEPAKGKLGPPGGFVDIGETAETAVRREIREEVGLELENIRFLCSQPNQYFYKDVTYPVLDFFFTADAIAPDTAQSLDDVESHVWLAPAGVSPDDLAFPSMRAALKVLLGQA
jgi:ADP-ribose pyrophosphatase YjhB (NUDIX family)